MAISDADMAIRSGIPIDRIREISQMESWENVPVNEARRFFAAGNFDPTKAEHRARVVKYQQICTKRNATPFHYLRRSPKWETEFLPLLLKVTRIMKSQNGLLPATKQAVSHARS
jgi:hypothetical protein